MHTFYQLGKNMHFSPFYYLLSIVFFPQTCYLAIFFLFFFLGGGQSENIRVYFPDISPTYLTKHLRVYFPDITPQGLLP